MDAQSKLTVLVASLAVACLAVGVLGLISDGTHWLLVTWRRRRLERLRRFQRRGWSGKDL